MTTPERLRRRQLIEGSILIILGIVMILQAWYFHHNDIIQKACLAKQITAVTRSYTARADITERDSNAKTTVIRDVAMAKTQEDVRRALDTFLKDQTQIDRDRANHPVPPFPPGTCS